MMKRRSCLLIVGLLVLMMLPFGLGLNIQINAAPTTGTAPLKVTFSPQTSLELNSSLWDFNNDGVTDDTSPNAEYIFQTSGEYHVQFKGESNDGQVLTGESTIIVNTKAAAKITGAVVSEGNESGNNLDANDNLDAPDTNDTTTNDTTTLNQTSAAFSVSVLASKSKGTAPLTVQFTTSTSTTKEVEYAWDFNDDLVTDSALPEPTYTFNVAGEQKVRLTVTEKNGSSVIKLLTISIQEAPENELNYSSYFPTELQEGENEITFIIINNGKEKIEDITGKIIGSSIKFISSSEIQSLAPAEEDSIILKINFLKSGTIPGTLKLKGKSIPITFTVTPKKSYSQEELSAKLEELKAKVQALDEEYYEKKSQEYLITEVFESIKSAKGKAQQAQEQLLTNNLEGAAVTLNILSSIVDDATSGLENAKKKEVTMIQWLKENAVAITAIIAALGTLSGILVKVTKQAKKIGEDVKNKVSKRDTKKEREKETENDEEKEAEEKEAESDESKSHSEKKKEEKENDSDEHDSSDASDSSEKDKDKENKDKQE